MMRRSTPFMSNTVARTMLDTRVFGIIVPKNGGQIPAEGVGGDGRGPA